jgi:Holliday junction resolvasome RuvABC endonuclease subunit
MIHKPLRVLAIDPARRGAGFAVLEWPLTLVDWGVRNARTQKQAKTMGFIGKLIAQYQPTVVVVETCTVKTSRRSRRVKTLIGQIIRMTKKRNITVKSFSRTEVGQAFQAFGETTKYGIAKSIISQLPELTPSMPRFRKPWMSDDHRMPIFTATSLGLIYLYTRNRAENR